MAKKETFGNKLRQEREGADNTLRTQKTQEGKDRARGPDRKKAGQRKRIRHEAEQSVARRKKLRRETDGKQGNGAKGAKAGMSGSSSAEKAAASRTTEKSAALERPKKPGNLLADTVSAKAHQSIRHADQDENAGVESAHFAEGAMEGAVRAGSNLSYGHKLRQYRKASRVEQGPFSGTVGHGAKADAKSGSNIFSRWKQRQEIKKEYAAAKAAGASAHSAAAGASGTVRAAKETVSVTERALLFVKTHSHILLICSPYRRQRKRKVFYRGNNHVQAE